MNAFFINTRDSVKGVRVHGTLYTP